MDALGQSGSHWLEDGGGSERREPVPPRPRFGPRSITNHKLIVLLGCVIGLAAGLFYVRLKPVAYTASTQLLVYNRQIATGPDAIVFLGSVDVQLVQNQIEILRSRSVLSKVIDTLDLTRDPEYFFRTEGTLQRIKSLISFRSAPVLDEKTLAYGMTLAALRHKLMIRRVGTSHIVQVNVTASGAAKAARICNETAAAYLQERGRAMGEAPSIRELYQGLGPSAYVISEAEPPVEPDGPPTWLVVFGAVLLGLAGGACLSVLIDVLDDTIRDPEQLEHWLGFDCLAVIPRLAADQFGWSSRRTRSGQDHVFAPDAASRPRNGHSTAMRALRSALAAIQDSEPFEWRSLGVTSVRSGDGSTTIAIALARLMGASGTKVLLIDAVPEQPSLSRWAASARRGGRTDDGILVDAQSGLDVLPVDALAGFDPQSICPASLSESVRHALRTYERVIVDLPSLVSGADVRAAAAALDGILLVVSCGATSSELARQAIATAGEAQPKIIGAVLNRVEQRVIEEYGDGREPTRGEERFRPNDTAHSSEAAIAGQTT